MIDTIRRATIITTVASNLVPEIREKIIRFLVNVTLHLLILVNACQVLIASLRTSHKSKIRHDRRSIGRALRFFMNKLHVRASFIEFEVGLTRVQLFFYLLVKFTLGCTFTGKRDGLWCYIELVHIKFSVIDQVLNSLRVVYAVMRRIGRFSTGFRVFAYAHGDFLEAVVPVKSVYTVRAMFSQNVVTSDYVFGDSDWQ